MQTDTPIRARLAAWVESKRDFAAARSDPDAALMAWHDWLGGELARLAEDETPDHLIGLTAWDLSEAQAALIRPLADAATA
ncbi:MAG TPA: hypothetical protein VGL73_16650 [Caulobacteraceae bacterium]|jgi:hypothetical protein